MALSDPFDLSELCRGVEAQRGRRIILVALPLSAAGPCGLWLATDEVDFICFEEYTSVLHQRHIVLHELGHILCAHSSPHALHQVLEGLVPMLSREALRNMLARQHNRYQHTDELEAEVFAYEVLSRVDRMTRAASIDQQELDVVPRRILSALEA
ncbi:hypothetical protein Rhe02_86340 [Rhizocola hellebori]|uniref:IrrE N-terminal-like domain-containing protein n=1 Tax=Rhizocola hellebori TaxID=1392758 RepID=A0A8J3QJ31_9ACTN|nr:hypothetical protein [Rhizocola hellebori]GIH10567.1 hypothetical protein Rhe02_86340 [Rhizocola hellebori]